VLVVDDDEHLRTFVADSLKDEGLTVIEAANGRRALERIAEVHPSMILLDISMPEMDGFQFLEAYRATPEPHAPVVLFSAEPDLKQRAESVKVDGVLAKPFNLEELFDVVRKHTGGEETSWRASAP
jgi:CheY-like chemotaxis protein